MDRTPELERMLTTRFGLDVGSLGPLALGRALGRRMQTLGLAAERRPEFVGRLLTDAAEQQELVEELVVPESWFFRDEHPFRRLKEHAIAWAAGCPGRVYRCLSLPCAGGEEPYSIVLSLIDAGLPPDGFEVVAVDVSERSLERARRGVFSERSVRAVHRETLARSFRREGRSWALRDDLRGRVDFRRGNILETGLFGAAEPFQALFCRNLLIYLTGEARQKAVENLEHWLAPDGILFVGHAEGLSGVKTRLVPRRPIGGFAYGFGEGESHGIVARSDRLLPRAISWTPPVTTYPTPRRSVMEAGAGPGEALPRPVETIETALREIQDLANARRYREALDRCEREARRRGPSAELFHHMGMIHVAAGSPDLAREWLGRAIYLEPDHQEALLALSLLAERGGDAAAASRYRRRADRARSKGRDA